MNAWPDASAVERFLALVRRRLVIVRALEGTAVGCLVAALLVAGRFVPDATIGANVIVAVVGGAAIARVLFGEEWRFGWWRSLPELAGRVEQHTKQGHNLLFTASELLGGARGYVPEIVMSRASSLVDRLDTAALFPARRAVSGLVVSAFVLLASVALRQDTDATGANRPMLRAGGPAIHRVLVRVTPPSYSGVAAQEVVNPTRIEALASSRVELEVDATAASVVVETVAGSQVLERRDGSWLATIEADADGFMAFEPRDSRGAAGARYLVGLAVIPDRPPRVTLSSPGRDLFFSTVPGSIPVAINAEDDLALSSLRLRYTAVSGSGERFTFTERDVPVNVRASSPRSWSAQGTWRLDELDLAPGDLIVYRAVATDRRPGAPPVESGSYVIEVVTPGAIAAEGFAADDERDRYAVSQQMVILKTERLIGRRAAWASDSVRDEARRLAAEQRQVRAEFVFMMGGEVEDLAEETSGTLEVNEVAEAEAEGDLLAGRLQNQGRVDMMRAIRAMSRASAALTDANLDQALRDERAALENLMRAFARSRFILRALTQRERIDLDRRLSGALNLTAGLSGPEAAALPDPKSAALRRLLAELAAMTSGDSSDIAADRAIGAALDLLRSDPGSDTLRVIASRVQELAIVARRHAAAGVPGLDELIRSVSSLLSAGLPDAPRRAAPVEAGQLEGALRDALRRSGRR